MCLNRRVGCHVITTAVSRSRRGEASERLGEGANVFTNVELCWIGTGSIASSAAGRRWLVRSERISVEIVASGCLGSSNSGGLASLVQ